MNPPSATPTLRLSLMMFLQFFTWGAWFVTLGACLDGNGLATIIGAAYGSAPIAAIFAPLFLGLVADRFFPSEKVMGVLLLLGGLAMERGAPEFALLGGGQSLGSGLHLGVRFAARFDGLGQPDFVVLGQQGVLADVGQIQTNKVLVVSLEPLLCQNHQVLRFPTCVGTLHQ